MTPLIDITTDGHVHTRFCNHAVGEMAEYVAQAVTCGLARIVFLEHLETGICYEPRSWLGDEEFSQYFREGERLKRQYQGQIEILLGVETGANPEELPAVKKRLKQYPFERIGLSCHFHRQGETHLNLLSRRAQSLEKLAALGADRVVTSYFDALIAAVDLLDADVLCHLDAVMRHHPGLQFHAGHREQIRLILDRMQEKDLALEINTSGFDYRGTPFPAPWIIREALRRGLRLFAGSDAHRPEEVGRHFHRLPGYLDALRDQDPSPATI